MPITLDVCTSDKFHNTIFAFGSGGRTPMASTHSGQRLGERLIYGTSIFEAARAWSAVVAFARDTRGQHWLNQQVPVSPSRGNRTAWACCTPRNHGRVTPACIRRTQGASEHHIAVDHSSTGKMDPPRSVPFGAKNTDIETQILLHVRRLHSLRTDEQPSSRICNGRTFNKKQVKRYHDIRDRLDSS